MFTMLIPVNKSQRYLFPLCFTIRLSDKLIQIPANLPSLHYYKTQDQPAD